MPEKTIGFTSLKPASGVVAGSRVSVTVSPTLVSCTDLMLQATKPTSPGPSSWTARGKGANTPSSLTS